MRAPISPADGGRRRLQYAAARPSPGAHNEDVAAAFDELAEQLAIRSSAS